MTDTGENSILEESGSGKRKAGQQNPGGDESERGITVGCVHSEIVKWHVRAVQPSFTVTYPCGTESEGGPAWLGNEEDQDFEVCVGCGQ
eukprot:CAMPEP_0196739930 /NCGR_PEP_ID=MMETSP1091-20130531/27033_1 /TAXON_ID=302021 /ORGANISM="Rhodomonas sp., Strain CCMP768" /LENGTH=88 /DNA_ID=CAMNT_0042084771 /DNA_START=73 /DNA_END=336 /DNA_ORIENTATION=+